MDDRKDTLEHEVIRPLEDSAAFEECGTGVD